MQWKRCLNNSTGRPCAAASAHTEGVPTPEQLPLLHLLGAPRVAFYARTEGAPTPAIFTLPPCPALFARAGYGDIITHQPHALHDPTSV